MAKANTRLTMSAGSAINKDMFYMSCTLDELEASQDGALSRLVFYQDQTNEKWFYHDLPDWRVVSTCFPTPEADGVRKIYALSEQGDVECYSRQGSVIEKIADAGLATGGPNLGYVTRIREIGNHLYVCGYGGQVYRREASGWVHFDAQLLQTPLSLPDTDDPAQFLAALVKTTNETIGLVDINGSSEDHIYIAGNDGYVAFFDGGHWTKLPQVTAANLKEIHPVSDVEVWIAGSKGTLLRGNATDGFKAVARKSLDTDFYALTTFQGSLYIGAGDGIYEFHDSGLQRLPISDKYGLTVVSSIDAKDGVLWALSERKLVRFDGATWNLFENPHNV